MSRPETGTMKFGVDWRGVFIRGDDAFHFANQLHELLRAVEFLKVVSGAQPDEFLIRKKVLEGLSDLLASADVRRTDTETQLMKPFDECVLEPPPPVEPR